MQQLLWSGRDASQQPGHCRIIKNHVLALIRNTILQVAPWLPHLMLFPPIRRVVGQLPGASRSSRRLRRSRILRKLELAGGSCPWPRPKNEAGRGRLMDPAG